MRSLFLEAALVFLTPCGTAAIAQNPAAAGAAVPAPDLSGTWEAMQRSHGGIVVGDQIAFHTLFPQREDWNAQFVLTGDTLTFSMGGQSHRYLRARPLIPMDVEQPL